MKFGRASIAAVALLALSGCGIFKGGQKKTPVLGNRVPILASETDVSPDKTIADVQVLLPPPAANDSWAQPGGSAAKSMGQLALGDSLTRAWTANVDGGSKPRTAGRGARRRQWQALYDGRERPRSIRSTRRAARPAGASTSPRARTTRAPRFGGGVSYEDGKLYATDGLGDVVALNAADGTKIWAVKPGGPLRGAPTLANGSAYVLSQDNQLFALSLADGSVQWTESGSLEAQGVFGVAAPAAASGTIIAGFSSGELSAYRYENGRSLWQDTLSRTSISTSVSSLSDIDADPVIDDGRVYAVGQGGRMVALDINTGQRLWEQNFAGISTPWVAGEWVFVITDDAKLVCMSRANGKIRWISQLRHFKNEKKHSGEILWVGPLLAGNRLLVVNSEGQLVSVSPADGSVTSTIKVGDAYSLSPVIANSTLYLVDKKGTISAYR